MASIDLSRAEISSLDNGLEEFFSNFSLTCRKITYNVASGNGFRDGARSAKPFLKFLETTGREHWFDLGDAGADISARSVPSLLRRLPAFGRAAFGAPIGGRGFENAAEIAEALAAARRPFRMTIRPAARASKKSDADATRLVELAAGLAKDGAPVSLCATKRGIREQIEFNEKIANDFPVLAGALHIEPHAPANAVHNALLLSLALSSKAISAPTFMPRLSGRRPEAWRFTLEFLRSMGYGNAPGVFLIACPTCTRSRIAVIPLAKKIHAKVRNIEKRLSVAVMGCEVNGPGEASHADVGVAGGVNRAVMFEHGNITARLSFDETLLRLAERIDAL